MTSHFFIECRDCGSRTSFHPGDTACPSCGSLWREAKYDYAGVSQIWDAELSDQPFDIWRYRQLLPIRSSYRDLTFHEGGTPLLPVVNLGMILGHHHIYFKDERRGPTASFKDRQAAIAIPVLKEAGISEAVFASTGNVAIAYSAYAARAGIKLWAFFLSMVPADKMREVALYGTQVIKVTGSYDQAKKLRRNTPARIILIRARAVLPISSDENNLIRDLRQLTQLIEQNKIQEPANGSTAGSSRLVHPVSQRWDGTFRRIQRDFQS